MAIIPRRRVELKASEFFSALKYLFRSKKHRQVLISEFEERFADYIGVGHTIAVSSSRSGLALLLDTLSYEENDEVIMSSYNYHVVAALFKNKGCKPVFVDVDEKSWNIDVSLIEEKITDKTRFLVATHLYGKSCDMDELVRICKERNILLIEDVAHACGGEYKDKKLGSFGDIACFSFGTGKALVTLNGGMFAFKDEVLFKKFKEHLNSIGQKNSGFKLSKFIKPVIETVCTKRIVFPFFVYPILYLLGLIFPNCSDSFTEDKYVVEEGDIKETSLSFSWFQASLGLQQLKRLDALNNGRIYFAMQINRLLVDIDQVKVPLLSFNKEHIGLYYGIVANRAKELRKYLFLRGIDTKMGSMRACSALDFFDSAKCPVAEGISPNLIELPCYPSLSLKELYYQVNLIRKFYGFEVIPDVTV